MFVIEQCDNVQVLHMQSFIDVAPQEPGQPSTHKHTMHTQDTLYTNISVDFSSVAAETLSALVDVLRWLSQEDTYLHLCSFPLSSTAAISIAAVKQNLPFQKYRHKIYSYTKDKCESLVNGFLSKILFKTEFSFIVGQKA